MQQSYRSFNRTIFELVLIVLISGLLWRSHVNGNLEFPFYQGQQVEMEAARDE